MAGSGNLAWSIRRVLIVGCLALLIPLGWRVQHVVAELSREREARILYGEGVELRLAGRHDEAAAAFRKVVELMPFAEEAYSSLADAEFRRGNVDAAVQAYRTLLTIYPYSYFGSIYRALGFMEFRAGRWRDARDDLERAVGLDPGDSHALYLLGHTYRRLGETTAARDTFQRVVALHPDHTRAHEQLRRLSP